MLPLADWCAQPLLAATGWTPFIVLTPLSASHEAKHAEYFTHTRRQGSLAGPPGATALNGVPRREVCKRESSSGCLDYVFNRPHRYLSGGRP
jgi:hypothetical protein